MARYIIGYDLTDGSDAEYKAVKKAICDNTQSAQKRLETLWIAIARTESLPDLKREMLRDIRSSRNVGADFVDDRLDLVLGRLDGESRRPVLFHRTSDIESC